MRFCFALLWLALVPIALHADLVVAPKPPGWPTTDYQTIAADLSQVTFVAIDYGNGTTAIVADPVWLEKFKPLLANANGKPANRCFCINHPQITLLTKDRKLATLEVPHGEKLRFRSESYSGDFQVDPKTAKAIVVLAMSQRANAFTKKSKIPAKPEPPRKIEFKP